MGTKNRPGKFDCYVNADPDEPMFILLGRDPMAGALVREWARMREARHEDSLKIAEAHACADAMDHWAETRGRTPIKFPIRCQGCGQPATHYTIDGINSKTICAKFPACMQPEPVASDSGG